MSIVQPYLDKLDDISNDMEKIAKEIVKDNVDYIIGLNKYNLRSGFGANGKHISRRYSTRTQNTWRYKDPKPVNFNQKVTDNYYDFYWTGETQDNMYITFDSEDEFSIFSAAGKAKYLQDYYKVLYDFEMFGLNAEQNEHINNDIILPNLHKYILDNMVKL